VQFWAPDDGQKNRLKRVERLTEINKLWNVASCWLYSENVQLGVSCFSLRSLLYHIDAFLLYKINIWNEKRKINYFNLRTVHIVQSIIQPTACKTFIFTYYDHGCTFVLFSNLTVILLNTLLICFKLYWCVLCCVLCVFVCFIYNPFNFFKLLDIYVFCICVSKYLIAFLCLLLMH